MMVRIAHASLDENGGIKDGRAGDQTGQEVYIRGWYPKGWTCLIRPKDPAAAEKIAQAAEAGASNPNIGYDQWNRNSLRRAARAVGFDLSKITAPCECDCSAFVAVCCEAAGINMDETYTRGNAATTIIMAGKYALTNAFNIIRDASYLNSPDKLLRGDILVKEGVHTVMVLDNGTGATYTVKPLALADPDHPVLNLVTKAIGEAAAKEAVKVYNDVNLSASVYDTLKAGTKVGVLLSADGWLHIVWPGAKCGYAYTPAAAYDYKPYGKTNVEYADYKDSSLAGTYKATTNVHMRTGAGMDHSVILTIPQGAIVRCYGYYSKAGDKIWLYVAYGKQAGFVCKDYLAK